MPPLPLFSSKLTTAAPWGCGQWWSERATMRSLLPAAHPIVCSRHRLTVTWLVWAQKEARASMELHRALPDGVEHELFLAALD